ncbi:helix-turn-helix domain-containing protein [Phytoactinopolyspora mesophila]|nr:helix-turn-helix domain-containing protein [Phytoactinopolyspora mesophila]
MLAQRHRPISERVRGGTRGGSPGLNQAALSAREDIMSILASWAGLVVDERELSSRPERSVRSLSEFLLTQLDWLSDHPAAGDLVSEIHEVATAAQRVMEPDASVRLQIGPCHERDCDGTAHVTTRSQMPADYQVRCTYSQERRLADVAGPAAGVRHGRCAALNSPLLRPDADPGAGPLLTTEMAALVAGVPNATIRKWASRGKLTRYGRAAQVRYDLRELLEFVTKRHG